MPFSGTTSRGAAEVARRGAARFPGEPSQTRVAAGQRQRAAQGRPGRHSNEFAGGDERVWYLAARRRKPRLRGREVPPRQTAATLAALARRSWRVEISETVETHTLSH